MSQGKTYRIKHAAYWRIYFKKDSISKQETFSIIDIFFYKYFININDFLSVESLVLKKQEIG